MCISPMAIPLGTFITIWTYSQEPLQFKEEKKCAKKGTKTMKTITLCCCLFISNLHHIKIVFGYFCDVVYVSFGFILAVQKLHVPFSSLGLVVVNMRTHFCGILSTREQRLTVDDIHSLSFSSSIDDCVYRFCIDSLRVEGQRDSKLLLSLDVQLR